MKQCWMWLLLVAVLTGGCTEPVVDEVVRFKGGNITVKDLEVHAGKLARRKEYAGSPERLTPEAVLQHAINMEMLIAAGLDRKLHLDPKVREEIHGFMSDLFLKMLGSELVPEILREDIGEEDIRAYYEQHRDIYKEPDQVALSWIRTENRELADKISETVRNGQMTFEEAGADSPVKKGSYPLRPLNRYPASWRPVISGLDKGLVSLPVAGKEESHILRLDDFLPGKPLDYEERREYIRNDVLYAKYREAWDKAYENLRRKHEVQVNEDNFRHFSESFRPPGTAAGDSSTAGTEETAPGPTGAGERSKIQ